jgi:hypothetical protein
MAPLMVPAKYSSVSLKASHSVHCEGYFSFLGGCIGSRQVVGQKRTLILCGAFQDKIVYTFYFYSILIVALSPGYIAGL